MTAEDFFESEDNPINEIDKKGAWFGYSQLLQFAEAYADTHARQMAVDEKIKTIGFVKKIIHEMDWGVMDNDIDAHELLIRLDTFTANDRKEDGNA